MPIADLLSKEYVVHSASSLGFAVEGVAQVIRTMHLPKLIWLPQEEACATELVTETLHLSLVGTLQ